ncbi:hypothetical protein [Chryseobacterium sp. ZHDP1]|uniref:hypothetical protein n=1 Tax=Chryseobacterium sp. ZHDP1 TaxID=2838877 RepID=UPI001BDF7FB9|nr:hypothetical protein [Chryseobacterium sp. ZHDP1]QWA38854.1 hypothetical protein KKI44_01180 [Chryseobacterium sp. ZHDP1]
MIAYFKNKTSPVFYKALNQSEILQVTKEKHCIGISVLSILLKEILAGNIVEIDKDEFIAAYSEVKRELMNQNVLQEEEKELYLSELFKEWADNYFKALLNQDINKREAFEAMRNFGPTTFANMSSNGFKRNMKAWSQYNGFSFEDRIMKLVSGKTTEHIRITSKN